MSEAAKNAKRAIWAVSKVVDMIIVIVFILLISIGCFAIWDADKVHSAADASHYEIYKPTAENQGKTFEELQAINPEVFAWLTVYGTHIDYPVVQGQSNMKYINTNAEGRYSISGAIFLDYTCSDDFSDFSSILYGHHMEKNAMFGEIGNFVERSYFDARKYGMLYYSGEEHGLEFFAFVHADAYDRAVFRTRITDPLKQQEYLDMLLEIAILTRDIGVTIDDRLVLLATCSSVSTNGRDILVGRITDNLFEDPFYEEPAENDREIFIVDALGGWFAKIPLEMKIIMIAVLVILLILLLPLLIRKRKSKRVKHERTG